MTTGSPWRCSADADDNMVYVEITVTALDLVGEATVATMLTSDEAQCLANALQQRT